MPQNPLKSTHYIELGSYHYWPVLVPRGIRLYTYEQIPVFLKENPYITDGYRAHLPSKLCLKRCVSFSFWNRGCVASCLLFISRIPQYIHYVQWDCEHLESSARIPAVLLAGGIWHGHGPAVCRGVTRGLCDLFNRTVLFSGKIKCGKIVTIFYKVPRWHKDK